MDVLEFYTEQTKREEEEERQYNNNHHHHHQQQQNHSPHQPLPHRLPPSRLPPTSALPQRPPPRPAPAPPPINPHRYDRDVNDMMDDMSLGRTNSPRLPTSPRSPISDVIYLKKRYKIK